MNTQFTYNDTPITFEAKGDGVMINATEMAKPFGKTPKDYLRTDSAKQLIAAISNRQICLPTDIVRVVNGGSNSGTWMHEDVALDFAQWLSIDFRLWCNDKIKELMQSGSTFTKPMSMIDALQQTVNALKNHEDRIEVLEEKVDKHIPELKEKLRLKQAEADIKWDKSDRNDLYRKN